MRVMAIGAHPDDIELLCAGTLAKYAQQGHQVTMCYVCNGGLGHVEIMPPELKEVRKQESIDSANVIGAHFQWLDIDDADVRQSTNEAIARLVDAVREAQPDVIITHSPNDYMDDHRLVGELVLKASFDATIPHLVSNQETPAQLVPIFYMDTLMGVDFLPEMWVDISDTLETKRQMLACHESQYAWAEGARQHRLHRFYGHGGKVPRPAGRHALRRRVPPSARLGPHNHRAPIADRHRPGVVMC